MIDHFGEHDCMRPGFMDFREQREESREQRAESRESREQFAARILKISFLVQ
jgi:hypothetical protein